LRKQTSKTATPLKSGYFIDIYLFSAKTVAETQTYCLSQQALVTSYLMMSTYDFE